MTRICKKKTNQKNMPLKKTSLEILGSPNFASVGELAFRKKTNDKARSVYERIHKVSNYHYYDIYSLTFGQIKRGGATP